MKEESIRDLYRFSIRNKITLLYKQDMISISIG